MESIGELKKIKLFLAISAVATLLLGFLNHFIYEWSGGNGVAGLLLPPTKVFGNISSLRFCQCLLYSQSGDFFSAERSTTMPARRFWHACHDFLYYKRLSLLHFFARRAILPIDITIFTVAIALGYATAYTMFFKRHIKWLNILSCVGIVALYAAFFTLTYHAPKFFLFEEMFVTYTPMLRSYHRGEKYL